MREPILEFGPLDWLRFRASTMMSSYLALTRVVMLIETTLMVMMSNSDVDQGDVDNGVEHDDEGKLGTRRLQLQRKRCISWGSSGVPRCSYSGVLMSSLLNKVKEYIQSCKRYN